MMRIGTGFDTHRLKEGRKLILGGVSIDHELGLDGHSDADVLVHAVMDALLGAMALGDIGQHFPDTSSEFEGADSIALLRKVRDLLAEKGAVVANVDTTILAESPKMAPHIAAMRANISGALGISVDRISVKATTLERMGPLGRGEGIGAMASACVEIKE
jgi:2-C-methyl-D-erythritol 2,4-cyclodiphosphate synthase